MSGGHTTLSCDFRVGEVCVDSTDWDSDLGILMLRTIRYNCHLTDVLMANY